MHKLDKQTSFKPLTSFFDMPMHQSQPLIYFNGNSLGPKLKSVDQAILKQCRQWGEMGVRGHFDGDSPWVSFQEDLYPMLANLVGAHEKEVGIMGTLTGNLHLLLMSFYRPTPQRYKILRLVGFPSDTYAIDSQVKQRLQTISNFSIDPHIEEIVVTLSPDETGYITLSRFSEILEKEGESIALVFFEAIHYLTGQRFDLDTMTTLAHRYGCLVGFDLAHAIGNIPLALHDWDVDFAVWCHYKYVCAGPGAVAGLYIHERHLSEGTFRLSGWWGNNPQSRFEMRQNFEPTARASAWQLSTPEMFSLISLRESLLLFDKLNLQDLYEKNQCLSSYLIEKLRAFESEIRIITPEQHSEHGCQISFSLKRQRTGLSLEKLFLAHQVVCDVRPGVIRVAPLGLYNTSAGIDDFISILAHVLSRY